MREKRGRSTEVPGSIEDTAPGSNSAIKEFEGNQYFHKYRLNYVTHADLKSLIKSSENKMFLKFQSQNLTLKSLQEEMLEL